MINFKLKIHKFYQKSATIIEKLYKKPENTLVVLLEPNQESREETHPAGIGIETSLGALRIWHRPRTDHNGNPGTPAADGHRRSGEPFAGEDGRSRRNGAGRRAEERRGGWGPAAGVGRRDGRSREPWYSDSRRRRHRRHESEPEAVGLRRRLDGDGHRNRRQFILVRSSSSSVVVVGLHFLEITFVPLRS